MQNLAISIFYGHDSYSYSYARDVEEGGSIAMAERRAS